MMNQTAALQQGIDGLLFLKTHFNSPDYDEAILALEVIQMGLDGECDGLVSIASENIDSDVFGGDEKALGWRESELT